MCLCDDSHVDSDLSGGSVTSFPFANREFNRVHAVLEIFAVIVV
jgi:hypothetical protein